VLSRCQRFDLRRVSVAELVAHFAAIAVKEGVAVAPEALTLIARAADGSVRDGLSLLDQAIAQAEPGAPIGADAVVEMLGLANRMTVFDLFEALMAGRPAEALAITDRAHALGADFGVLLADLLDLVHSLARLKSVPDLRDSAELPEAERSRGAALAERLTMVTLGRAWQMLLKGVGEVEAAPDRRAAGEMVLIRLCHVAELPPPADLLRRLTDSPAPAGAPPAPPRPSPGGGGARAVANGGMVAEPAVDTTALASFPEVAALVAEQRDPILHAHLVHSVHLVRFAPPVIELRPEPAAPRDLAARLAAVLAQATGRRWTIALSAVAGEPTLAEQGTAADTARRAAAGVHPLVRAILDAFPGARIEAVHDTRADAYGLVAAPVLGGEPEPDGPEFAPVDAGFADGPPEDWET
jgi:DNA polymerase-3 subunit gamma/tau